MMGDQAMAAKTVGQTDAGRAVQRAWEAAGESIVRALLDRGYMMGVARRTIDAYPRSREASLAITKLDEARMWLDAIPMERRDDRGDLRERARRSRRWAMTPTLPPGWAIDAAIETLGEPAATHARSLVGALRAEHGDRLQVSLTIEQPEGKPRFDRNGRLAGIAAPPRRYSISWTTVETANDGAPR